MDPLSQWFHNLVVFEIVYGRAPFQIGQFFGKSSPSSGSFWKCGYPQSSSNHPFIVGCSFSLTIQVPEITPMTMETIGKHWKPRAIAFRTLPGGPQDHRPSLPGWSPAPGGWQKPWESRTDDLHMRIYPWGLPLVSDCKIHSTNQFALWESDHSPRFSDPAMSFWLGICTQLE